MWQQKRRHNIGCGICDGYKYGVRGRGLAVRRAGNLAIWEIEGFHYTISAGLALEGLCQVSLQAVNVL